MNLEEFEKMSDEEKNLWLFEAEKVGEQKDEYTRTELFKISNFFVEARTSLTGKFKRKIISFMNVTTA